MSKKAILPLLLALALLSGCGRGEKPAPEEEQEPFIPTQIQELTEPELEAAVRPGTPDAPEAIPLALPAEGGVLRISEGGVYLLSGTVEDGQILVDAPEDARVELLLNGVSLSRAGHAALWVASAGELVLRSAPDSVNRLCSTGDFTAKDTDKVDAAVFARCDLRFSGGGSLLISCDSEHGVVSKAALTVESGELNVVAGRKGLSAKESLGLEGGQVFVRALDKGLIAEGDQDQEELGCVRIAGGSLTVDAEDDAIHAAADVTVEAGELNLRSLDDAIHADRLLTVNGGSLNVVWCHEGLEAPTVCINGGEIRLLAEDDGINGSLGKDEEKGGDRMGGSPFAMDAGASLIIRGGTLFINAEGDGLDANGDLLVTVGEIYISGPTGDGNAALDYGTSGRIEGGTLIAAGSAGMAMNFGSRSTQGSILLNLGRQEAGTPVSLEDAQGRVLARYTPEKPFVTVVISCPALELGGSYTVRAGDAVFPVTLDSLILGSGADMGHGGPGGGPGGNPGDGPGGNPGDWPGGNPGGPPPDGGPGRR